MLQSSCSRRLAPSFTVMLPFKMLWDIQRTKLLAKIFQIYCTACRHPLIAFILRCLTYLLHTPRAIWFLDGDTLTFFNVFNDSVSIQTELTTYVRIKASDPRDKSTRLVEIKINPYQQPGTTDTPCIFAMINPYPTSSTDDLDDYLALRLENELLNQRLEVRNLLRQDLDSMHIIDE